MYRIPVQSVRPWWFLTCKICRILNNALIQRSALSTISESNLISYFSSTYICGIHNPNEHLDVKTIKGLESLNKQLKTMKSATFNTDLCSDLIFFIFVLLQYDSGCYVIMAFIFIVNQGIYIYTYLSICDNYLLLKYIMNQDT